LSVRYYCADEAATLALGARLAAGLMAGISMQFHLRGDLGAGKTTLVRGVLQGLGHSGRVKSPTYGLVENYQLGDIHICHFDLYRLAHPEELEFLGVRDLLDGQVAFFEWPERANGWLGAADVEIAMAVEGSGRSVDIQSSTVVGNQWFEQIVR
jgi:tRNA threonylcarbamoyladenosine biosynthesis protein TsaE